MPLKPATLIAIIGLLIAFTMFMLVTLETIKFTSSEIANNYFVVAHCFQALPLVNFLISLYIKQK